ncbi:hypothetical protein [uncultured Brevundimonas sp.]|uniref:hypothetical protein n=1 Tax=uncultured Brevundimonas sp. TaxID=213418 RepID=UPI0030EC0998
MPHDLALYATVVLILYAASALYWRKAGIPARYLLKSLAITVAVVFPLTLLGVAIGWMPLTLALVVLPEEWVRWWMVTRRPRHLRRRHVVIAVGTLFGLLETTNWLGIDKARVALADSGITAPWFVAADAAYIAAEFGFGVIVHGGLTALLFAVQGRTDNRERLALGVALAIALHLALDAVFLG